MTDRVDDPDGVLSGLEHITSSGYWCETCLLKFRENWNYILGHMEILAQPFDGPINNSF